MRVACVVLGVVALAFWAGCGGCGGDDDAGGGNDGGRRRDGAASDGPSMADVVIPPPPLDAGRPCVFALPVDILWVVDNSNSMAEEQNNIALNFPELMNVLTQPPDADHDGMPDYAAVADLRIGITSTDMGVMGTAGVIGCELPGDGGNLISTSRSTEAACVGVTSGDHPWIEYHQGDDPMVVAQKFSCLARLGTNGCGFEQQLEAGYQAITSSATPASPNAGFIRDDSLVAVVWITDEEDCSVTDPAIFDPSPAGAMRFGPYGTRCADHPEALQPIDRYVTPLMNLRLDRAGDVVVAAITGVPRDYVENPDAIDYDRLLASDAMQYRHDPMDMTKLIPACSVGGVADAIPARRIVQVVQRFAATGDGLVQSICSTDFRPAIQAIARLIATRICPPPI